MQSELMKQIESSINNETVLNIEIPKQDIAIFITGIVLLIITASFIYRVIISYWDAKSKKRQHDQETWEEYKKRTYNALEEMNILYEITEMKRKSEQIEDLKIEKRLNDVQKEQIRTATQMEGLIKSVDNMKSDVRDIRKAVLKG